MILRLKKILNTGLTSGDNQPDRSSEKPFIFSSLFYLSILLFIGLPMWFYTCSKTRYSLPNLLELEGKLNNSQLKLHLDVSVVQLSKHHTTKQYDDGHDDASQFENQQTIYLRTHLPTHISTSVKGVAYSIDWRVRRPTYDETKLFQLHSKKRSRTLDNENKARLLELEQNLMTIYASTNKFRLFFYLIEESDYSSYCDPAKTHTYTISSENIIYLCPSTALPSIKSHQAIVNLITDAVTEVYQETVDANNIDHILNNQVDLLHTLIPDSQDFHDLRLSHALADKIHDIFEKNVKNKFPELKELVNIRIVTQFIADIFDESLLSKTSKRTINVHDANTTSRHLVSATDNIKTVQVDRISDLFYKFESRLSKHSSKNVHHVLTIYPTSNENPLSFGYTTNNGLAFLESQDYKSLLLANDEKSLVLGLRAIVRRTVGLSAANLCQSCRVKRDVFFTRWELDALMGALILRKLQNTLISLKSISKQVIGIRIPKDVSSVANEAHLLSNEAIELLKAKRITESYRRASQAYELSEAAFYDPSLLELLYFPDDLKYAIYLPLFLPLALPLMTSLVRFVTYAISSHRQSGNEKVKIN